MCDYSAFIKFRPEQASAPEASIRGSGVHVLQTALCQPYTDMRNVRRYKLWLQITLIDKTILQDLAGISFYYCYYWENKGEKGPSNTLLYALLQIKSHRCPWTSLTVDCTPVQSSGPPIRAPRVPTGEVGCPIATEKVDSRGTWLEWPGINSLSDSVGPVIGLDSGLGGQTLCGEYNPASRCSGWNESLGKPGAVACLQAFTLPLNNNNKKWITVVIQYSFRFTCTT